MASARQPLRLFRLWWLIGVGILSYIVYVTLTPHPPPIPGRFTDKFFHILGYFVLMGWFGQLYKPSRSRYSLILGFISLGLVLEFSQLLVNTRSFDLADIVANTLGVVLAVLLLRGPLAMLLLYFEGIVFTTHANKPRQVCPRCQHLFSCQPEAITLCQCSAVVLSEVQRKIIQQRYPSCLCAACLQSLREEIIV